MARKNKEDLKFGLFNQKKKKNKKKEKEDDTIADWLSNKETECNSNSILLLVALVPEDHLNIDFKCVYF